MTSAAALLLLAACGDAEPPAVGMTAVETREAGAPLPEGVWRILQDRSALTFTAIHAGNSFDGEFKAFKADITFDPNAPETASISATIDMTSVDARDLQRNMTLVEADWFNVKAFPTARFESTSVRKVDDVYFEAAGRLTIRDVTRDVVLPFMFVPEGDGARVHGELTINRTDYGVGQGANATDEWVGYPVSIKVDLVAERPAP